MEPLGSIGSIPPKAAGSSHPSASAGKTVMLLSAKLREKLPGKQRSGCSASVLAPAASGPECREGACWELPHPILGAAARAGAAAAGSCSPGSSLELARGEQDPVLQSEHREWG